MLRCISFLRYPDGVAKDDGERWYLGTHTQEAKEVPGLRRFLSWPTMAARIAPPWTTVEALNRWDRVTELAFDDWESWHRAAARRYTPAPYGPRGFESETILIPDEPDFDFLADSRPPIHPPAHDPDRLARWLFLLRYREEVPRARGEGWYLGTHTQEARHMPGLCRYRSWNAHPRKGEPAPTGRPAWDRLTELAFADMEAWEEGAVAKMPRWSPPPYGQPGFLSVTAFIGETPQFDFLRDIPRRG